MKKSANGYFKFFNKDGISCRIKCDAEVTGSVIVKFKGIDDANWFYYSPKKEFRNCLDAATYILKNLENPNMVFKILPTSALKSTGEEYAF